MKHLLVKATVTAVEQGQFSAIAAAYSRDRQNEIVVPGAFSETIAAWKTIQKDIPLQWDHSKDPGGVIGSVDPATMAEREDGLYVEGSLDIEDSEAAREAWRSVKKNRMGLSFGYLVQDDHVREDGIRELRRLDLFEITLTPTPANADTRVLSTKSADLSEKRYVDPKSGKRMNYAELVEHATKAMPPKRGPIKTVSFEC